MNEPRRKKINIDPIAATWDIRLYTVCPLCGQDFDVIAAHPDFLAEQNAIRGGITQIECPECGNEFQIEMEF